MADELPLVGIEDFVKWTLGLPKVNRMLKKVVLDPWAVSAVSDGLAAHMMTSAFYASLVSDEARWPKVALTACSSKPSATIALFNPPVTADAVSIAKLAHAVSPWCRLACAEIDGSPMLIGILPSMGFGLGTFVTPRDRSGAPKHPHPSFKVTIRGPGHIDVLCDRGAFSYRGGKVESYSSILSSRALERLAVVMESRLTNLLGDEFASRGDADVEHHLARVQDPAIGELLRKGLAIGELLRKGVKAEVPTDCRIQLTIAELVWRIAELGHGGMLIVTDRPESPALSYRYPISRRRLQKAMVRYCAAAEDGHGTSRVPLGESPGTPSVHEGLSLTEDVAATAQLAGGRIRCQEHFLHSSQIASTGQQKTPETSPAPSGSSGRTVTLYRSHCVASRYDEILTSFPCDLGGRPRRRGFAGSALVLGFSGWNRIGQETKNQV